MLGIKKDMQISKANKLVDKGWCYGPWNSNLSVPIGYANAGINEPHVHSNMFEIYLVAQGNSLIRVEQESIKLSKGDVIILEPGEAHTFLENSDDYFHFVVHAPKKGEELLKNDKTLVGQDRLKI